MIKLALHLKFTFSKRNKPGIVLTYFDTAERGIWQRPLKHRGIWPCFVVERDCDHQEEENYRQSFRMRFITYDDWDGLIEDELRFPENPAWISELYELKKKHPNFKTDQPKVNKAPVSIHWVPYEPRIPEPAITPLFLKPGHKIRRPRQLPGQLQLIFA